MIERRRISVLLAAGAIIVAAFGFTAPAGAAPGAIRCDIAATVTLSTPPGHGENLLSVDGGTGNLSGTFVCTGTISGATTNSSGAFAFCSHRGATHSGPVEAQCAGVPDQGDAEPWADAIGPHAPIVSHVKSSQITIGLNTGFTCTHAINGHTLLTHAHLELPNFQCKNSSNQLVFGPVTARAEAASQIIINPLLECPAGPGGAKACFNTLTFVGELVAYSTT